MLKDKKTKFSKRAMHLAQVTAIFCVPDFQLFPDMKLAAWPRNAASNGKIAALWIVKTYGWTEMCTHQDSNQGISCLLHLDEFPLSISSIATRPDEPQALQDVQDLRYQKDWF